VYDRIDSTNRFLLSALKDGTLKPPICVGALQQVEGKGRYDRHWSSEPGGLYFSIATSIDKDTAVMKGYPLYYAMLLHQWLKKEFKIQDLYIKWPNDIYVNMHKLAGILTQTVIRDPQVFFVTGIGLNVMNAIPETAVSLQKLRPDFSYNIHAMLMQFITIANTSVYDHAVVHDYLNKYLWGKKQQRSFSINNEKISGIIEDVRDDFALGIRFGEENGVRYYDIGELS